MRGNVTIVGLLLLLAIPTAGVPSVSWADPASVLVIVQDNTGPETGTGRKNASQFVADYYMQKRGIPLGNIVHIATRIDSCGGPGCRDGNVQHSDSTNINIAQAQPQVFAPVLAKLKALGGKIKYIVPVYGVPVTIWSVPGVDALSLDSVLAQILLPTGQGGRATNNPYYNPDPASSPAHIDTSTAGVLLVSRLDGRTAAASAALVDKAIAGETAGAKGIGYFDYGPTSPLGSTSLNAYTLCKAVVPAQNCVLNDQSKTGGAMIGVGNPNYPTAPNTVWAWGGYDLGQRNAGVYSFVPGAVATQMNSNSAQTVRRPSSGAVVYTFLLNGVTATWGAVSEPFTSGYALGDNLLNHLWHGYTFGEAAYISAPSLNWMMVFVGDPLYRPSSAQSAAAP
jgi:uncharacterized protein (TIGR03790 family)